MTYYLFLYSFIDMWIIQFKIATFLFIFIHSFSFQCYDTIRYLLSTEIHGCFRTITVFKVVGGALHYSPTFDTPPSPLPYPLGKTTNVSIFNPLVIGDLSDQSLTIFMRKRLVVCPSLYFIICSSLKIRK